jgi:adenylate cyclase
MLSNVSNFVFGEPIIGELPERVRNEICAKQDASERLISWVLLVLVIFFGSLWLIAPKNESIAGFQPVPWSIGGYFVFTLLRLVLSYKVRLPGWFLSLSVLADMTLLMVMIWSFHIQYDQPPSFYLKAPTLMYVFIFIALRALRFEVQYVLLAGASAIAGWSIMMYFAIKTDLTMTMVTRDYVEYLTTNSILIGAEVDKMVSMGLVTIVLALVVIRARRFVFHAIREHAAAQDLSRFVSKEVANRVTSADRQIEPGDGENRHATLVFTDIEGFSTVSERMTAQELATTLNDYFAAVTSAIDQFGGVITQYQGDAMLITFNAVKDDPEHELNAVKTAIMIDKISRSRTFNGATMRTRCGINTGDASVGAVGADTMLSFTVHGDDVNLAARLEQLNKNYGTYVMMSEATYDAVRDHFTCDFICEQTVRGRETPVKVYSPAKPEQQY